MTKCRHQSLHQSSPRRRGEGRGEGQAPSQARKHHEIVKERRQCEIGKVQLTRSWERFLASAREGRVPRRRPRRRRSAPGISTATDLLPHKQSDLLCNIQVYFWWQILFLIMCTADIWKFHTTCESGETSQTRPKVRGNKGFLDNALIETFLERPLPYPWLWSIWTTPFSRAADQIICNKWTLFGSTTTLNSNRETPNLPGLTVLN